MSIADRFPKLQIKPETFEKHKSTLLLTGAASLAGSGVLFVIDALGFVGDTSDAEKAVEKLTVVIEEVAEVE